MRWIAYAREHRTVRIGLALMLMGALMGSLLFLEFPIEVARLKTAKASHKFKNAHTFLGLDDTENDYLLFLIESKHWDLDVNIAMGELREFWRIYATFESPPDSGLLSIGLLEGQAQRISSMIDAGLLNTEDAEIAGDLNHEASDAFDNVSVEILELEVEYQLLLDTAEGEGEEGELVPAMLGEWAFYHKIKEYTTWQYDHKGRPVPKHPYGDSDSDWWPATMMVNFYACEDFLDSKMP